MQQAMSLQVLLTVSTICRPSAAVATHQHQHENPHFFYKQSDITLMCKVVAMVADCSTPPLDLQSAQGYCWATILVVKFDDRIRT